jgi:hypothetical protein
MQRSYVKKRRKKNRTKREGSSAQISSSGVWLRKSKAMCIDAAMCSFSCTYLFEAELAIELEAFT